jgi:dTDP-N-acetylfucosamine:lipid II N-acetylfucosaminyltransferase
MRIVHIAGDEKFIDQALRQFDEILPGQNQCMIVTKRWLLRHVRHPSACRVSALMAAWGSLRRSLRECDLVVMHSLTPVLWQASQWLPQGKPLLWLGFGFDYYDLINANGGEGCLGPLTAAFLRTRRSGLRKWLHNRKQMSWSKVKQRALARITHFAPILSVEYQMIRERHPDFPAQFVPWSYSSVEDSFASHEPVLAQDANDILVGNSAAGSNNHLESIDLLKSNHCWGGRKIVMPLSYGNRDYRKVVLDRGREAFGERFHPLLDFVASKEYMMILSHCRTVVFNHLRQQAVGNILILLHQGSVVFMHSSGPVFRVLREAGAVLFSLEELAQKPELIDARLSVGQVERNRRVIKDIWGREQVSRRTKAMIEAIFSQSGRTQADGV